MRVKERMIGTPYYCQLDINLEAVTALMRVGNCGFLPDKGANGKVVGVITDCNICIALGTRHCLPRDLTVREVMSNRLFTCSPDCSVHAVLRIMENGSVRRSPMIAEDGSLVGVISMDDLLLKSEPPMTGIKAELSTDEIVQAHRAFGLRRMPQMVLVNAA